MDNHIEELFAQLAELTVAANDLRRLGPFDMRAGLERFLTLQVGMMGALCDEAKHVRGELVKLLQTEVER